ncbi:hypothetical protein RIF29_25450 [Crotalaria pallida]|uniref:Uncharacterized protein n=1 Tax=Crotalaria pallida TaxID=3830 RepID=A0AAN9ENS8_CROPI
MIQKLYMTEQLEYLSYGKYYKVGLSVSSTTTLLLLLCFFMILLLLLLVVVAFEPLDFNDDEEQNERRMAWRRMTWIS